MKTYGKNTAASNRHDGLKQTISGATHVWRLKAKNKRRDTGAEAEKSAGDEIKRIKSKKNAQLRKRGTVS